MQRECDGIKKQNNRKLGDYYEQKAVEYLKREGYRILERNFHAGRFGEIDIIAMNKEGILVIVECKYRKQNEHGDPLEAVDYRKQKQISKTTLFYFGKKGYGMEQPCRFDVIGIYGDGSVRHIENAFDFCL